MLAKWSEESAHQRSAAVRRGGQKALLTLPDENGEEVGVTVDLAGAEWEYEDAGAVLPELWR